MARAFRWMAAFAVSGAMLLFAGHGYTQPAPEKKSEKAEPAKKKPAKKKKAETSGDDPAATDNKENKEKAAARTTPKGVCLTPDQFYDKDGDVQRNAKRLASPALCLRLEVFTEGNLRWVLQIVENRKNPKGPLWAIPHDNENAAFDSGVYGVLRYGGTMVAVETGGKRFNATQDPNRNFDADTGEKCPQQNAASPEYTKRFLRLWDRSQPIMALHSNERGYEGDQKGGKGHISMQKPPRSAMPFRAVHPMAAQSPDDTLIFVASIRRPDANPDLAAFVKALNERGINVLYEMVSPKNDCSMSNYAALKGISNYINIEVLHGDRDSQMRILNIVMELKGIHGIGGPHKRDE